ncbi:MAG TPA: PssD/Cps14F family polysaccharide biosynthesis glycosyltransferase [Syntrophorhabdaceae bacterium]|nr:PssD/Cps14F family polysaccharide biosynthesis glycosyltransferase [Syntrophorhabdaceae bacterium]
MNIYIVASPGGHMTQALSVMDSFEGENVYLITLDFPNIRNLSINGLKEIYKVRLWFGYSMKLGVPFTLLVSFWTIFKIFFKKRPHLIFSTGSEIAVPAFFVGKFLFRARTIYMESLTRVHSLSMTGKLLYRFADVFLVQWKELIKKYNKAIYRGRLI